MAISKNTKKSKAAKSKKTMKITRTKTSAIKKIAEDVIVNKLAETKRINHTINNFGLVGPLSNGLDSTIKVLNPASGTGSLQSIPQGTGQATRIGNKIQTKKCTLKGVIHINTFYDGTVNYNMCPLYVVLYVFRLKGVNQETVANVESICNSSFFQNGSQSKGFTGFLMDIHSEVNTNVIHLLKKKIYKVGVSNVVSGFGVNNPNNQHQQYGDGTVSIGQLFSLDLTDCLYKTYQYNDTENTPQQSQTYFMWIPMRIDGSQIITSLGASSGPIPCYVDFSWDYHYVDI